MPPGYSGSRTTHSLVSYCFILLDSFTTVGYSEKNYLQSQSSDLKISTKPVVRFVLPPGNTLGTLVESFKENFAMFFRYLVSCTPHRHYQH